MHCLGDAIHFDDGAFSERNKEAAVGNYLEKFKRLVKTAKERGIYPEAKNVDHQPFPEIVIGGRSYICLCSNNYLGLSVHPAVKKAASEAVARYGVGATESRLLAGNLTILEELEAAIADFKKAPKAAVFLSGFAVNLGVIPLIFSYNDKYGLDPANDDRRGLIIKDALCHQSILDGCRLNRCPKETFRHNDMQHLEDILKKHDDKDKLIITDGIFSVDGDLAPLPDIVWLARKYDALIYLDDAHGTAVIGENGRGTPEYFGVEGEIDFTMGSLSKGVGCLGGYITARDFLIDGIKRAATTFMFTSALPPEQVAAITAALNIVHNQPELRTRLWDNVAYLKNGLTSLGFDLVNTASQIIPILIGDEQKTARVEERLFEKGILAMGIYWPATGLGKSRIRCSVMATHTHAQIDKALSAFEDVGRETGLI